MGGDGRTAALGLTGRTAEALAAANQGLEAAGALGVHSPWSSLEVLWARVLALAVAGRLEEARGLVEPGAGAWADGAEGSPQLVGMGLGFRGLVAKLRGDHATARGSLREAITLLDRADMYHFVRLWLAELACCGQARVGREVYDEAVERDIGTNRVFEPWIALDGPGCAGLPASCPSRPARSTTTSAAPTPSSASPAAPTSPPSSTPAPATPARTRRRPSCSGQPQARRWRVPWEAETWRPPGRGAPRMVR